MIKSKIKKKINGVKPRLFKCRHAKVNETPYDKDTGKPKIMIKNKKIKKIIEKKSPSKRITLLKISERPSIIICLILIICL